MSAAAQQLDGRVIQRAAFDYLASIGANPQVSPWPDDLAARTLAYLFTLRPAEHEQGHRQPVSPRAYVQREEWWPVYEVTVTDDGPRDVPPDLVARYKAALKEWNAVQDELAKIAEPAQHEQGHR